MDRQWQLYDPSEGSGEETFSPKGRGLETRLIHTKFRTKFISAQVMLSRISRVLRLAIEGLPHKLCIRLV